VSKRGEAPLSNILPLSFEGEALPLRALAQRGDKGGEVDKPLLLTRLAHVL